MTSAELHDLAQAAVGAVFAVAASENMGRLYLELREIASESGWRVLLTFSRNVGPDMVRDRARRAVALRRRQTMAPLAS
jgi:hypothetical protein